MKQETLNELIKLLYNQEMYTRQAYARKAPKLERECQESYTAGIKTALEIILTEAYTQDPPAEYKSVFIPCVYKAPRKRA